MTEPVEDIVAVRKFMTLQPVKIPSAAGGTVPITRKAFIQSLIKGISEDTIMIDDIEFQNPARQLKPYMDSQFPLEELRVEKQGKTDGTPKNVKKRYTPFNELLDGFNRVKAALESEDATSVRRNDIFKIKTGLADIATQIEKILAIPELSAVQADTGTKFTDLTVDEKDQLALYKSQLDVIAPSFSLESTTKAPAQKRA